jgi:hypothetical protein
MKISDYFKKHLEDLFLNTKVVRTAQYQTLLDEHCKNAGKVIEQNPQYIMVAFEFEDKLLLFKMNIAEGKCFPRIVEIEEKIVGN